MQLGKIKKIYHEKLDDSYAKEEVDNFFYMLIEHHLQLERFSLALQPNLIVSEQQQRPLLDALSKLQLQQPIQQIIGKAFFMDIDFLVNENVLIPRPETEELVRWIIKEVQAAKGGAQSEKKKENFQVLDIGTGSGCIAISLAKNLPHIKMVAMDVSDAALEIARLNADDHKVDIKFFKDDVLNPSLDEEGLNLNFDIIVSNPPYVRESEKAEMHLNVLNHEPRDALFVPDENPLLFYNAISDFAKKRLKPNGKLFFEINEYLGKETRQLLKEHNFSEIELRKDFFGKDRMLKGVL